MAEIEIRQSLLCYCINSRLHIEIGDLILCIMIYLANFDFPLPENFNDDYEGRLAAKSQNMMEIGTHLNRRDMKQIPPGVNW